MADDSKKNEEKEIDQKDEAERLEKITRYVGNLYKKAKKRKDICEFSGGASLTTESYKDDCSFIYAIDRILPDCSKNTEIIIRHEYLQNSEKFWYRQYFSTTRYYLLRKKAVEEFISCLDI